MHLGCGHAGNNCQPIALEGPVFGALSLETLAALVCFLLLQSNVMTNRNWGGKGLGYLTGTVKN